MSIEMRIRVALLGAILATGSLALAMGADSAERPDDYCGLIGSASTTHQQTATVYYYHYTTVGDTELCGVSDRNIPPVTIEDKAESTTKDTSDQNNTPPVTIKDETDDTLEDTDKSNDKERTIIDSTRSTKSDTGSLETRTATETPPIRTINEGQTTTFTVPNPSTNDRRTVTQCANFADERAAPAPAFRSDGTLVCDHSISVWSTHRSRGRPDAWVVGNSVSTFGPCRGPYTVEIITPDSRVEHTSGRRIRVTTSSSDNLDDSGSLGIEYFLVGTSTRTFAQTHPGSTVQTSTTECTLTRTTRVEVRPARRSGMTPAVALHAPSEEYLNTPSTTTWECTTEIVEAGVQCSVGTIVSKTIQPTFPTPSGCTVVVTVAANGRGHGSTSCLPRAQLESHGTMIGVDIDTLPVCPASTHTDDMNAIPEDSSERKRCVAKN